MKSARAKTKANPEYYRLLAERLEVLLDDIESAGTPPDDDLVQRLESLLAEARAELQGRGSGSR